ncbi:clustered mitochondria-domain-containing protein [Cladochytrium replicatum]|nr:clustered mitochondria-domain-containing protein [Cladochytrium replicatum]
MSLEDLVLEERTESGAEGPLNAPSSEQPQVIETLPIKVTLVLPLGTSTELLVHGHGTIQDVRQHVFESPECQSYTCFFFSYNGERVNEMMEVAELPGIETKTTEAVRDIPNLPAGTVVTTKEMSCTLHLVPDVYTEREVRIHLVRIREILTNYQSPTTAHAFDLGSSFLSNVSGDFEIFGEAGKQGPKNKEKKAGKKSGSPTGDDQDPFRDYNIDAPSTQSLESFVPKGFNPPPINCLNQFALSAWNPPPHYRRIAGDVMYIRIITLEGQTAHITCSGSGFFVNKSTDSYFDPTPRTTASGKPQFYSHTLPHLLSQFSKQFAANFESMMQITSCRHPYEFLLSSSAAYPWCVRKTSPEGEEPSPFPHTADPGLLMDIQLSAAETLDQFNARDWNEDLQSARELPRVTSQDRVLREQAIAKVHNDFVEAAVRGAVLVADRSLPALNPHESDTSQQIYLHNNIFFSHGWDGRAHFDQIGGPAAAHVAVSKDIDGIKALTNLDYDFNRDKPEDEIEDGGDDVTSVESGLFTVATAVVDFRGYRVVAQSIVPGILKKSQTSENASVVYGSVDGGKEISSDPAFHNMLEKVAPALRLSKHEVTDGNGAAHKLYSSVEVKGIVGDDRRKYLLDLYRMAPVDVDFLDELDREATAFPAYPHRMTLLRYELLDIFHEESMKAAIAKARGKWDAERQSKKEEEDESDAVDEAEEQRSLEAALNEAAINVRLEFNTDLFSDGVVPKKPNEQKAEGTDDAAETEKKTQEQTIRIVSRFLRQTTIPSVVVELMEVPSSTPMDGESLTKFLHQRGINMRYLGRLATTFNLLGTQGMRLYFRDLLVQEMIARAVKHILRELLRTTPAFLSAHCISHVFNCLFSKDSREVVAEIDSVHLEMLPEITVKSMVGVVETVALGPATCPVTGHSHGPTPDDHPDISAHVSESVISPTAYTSLTPASLRSKIAEEVRRRYRFDLNAPTILKRDANAAEGVDAEASNSQSKLEELFMKRQTPLLRSVCLKVGIQIQAKDYGFVSSSSDVTSEWSGPTFAPADILSIYPVVKHAEPKAWLGDEAHEHALLSLSHGQRAVGLELMTEAMGVYEQVRGLVHPETGRCYAQLAMLHFENNDRDTARVLQRKAVIVAERTNGVDDPDTLQQYMNLAYFEFVSGNEVLGLGYMRHALRYWELLCSEGKHPDTASADANIAAMLQKLKRFDLSTRFYERAARTNEELLGKDHALTAVSYESLTKSYLMRGDFRKALTAEKHAYQFYRDRLGEADPKTKEAALLLQTLTEQAVKDAKREKEDQARKKKIRGPNGNGNGATSNVEADPSISSKGHLPVEELLKFIGEPQPVKRSTGTRAPSSIKRK